MILQLQIIFLPTLYKMILSPSLSCLLSHTKRSTVLQILKRLLCRYIEVCLFYCGEFSFPELWSTKSNFLSFSELGSLGSCSQLNKNFVLFLSLLSLSALKSVFSVFCVLFIQLFKTEGSVWPLLLHSGQKCQSLSSIMLVIL